MRVFCLYRPNTEHERSVIEFNTELKRRYNTEIEMFSMDTVEGDRLASTYDILQFPSVVVVDSTGTLHQLWDSGVMPLINEVHYYLDQA